MNDQASNVNDDGIDPAARAAGHQPALTGCPWHDVNEMLQAAGLSPTCRKATKSRASTWSCACARSADSPHKIRRVGKGALAPCPLSSAALVMVGSLRFAHPTIQRLLGRHDGAHHSTFSSA